MIKQLITPPGWWNDTSNKDLQNSTHVAPPGELDLSENPLGADGAKELAKALSFLAAIFLAKRQALS